MKKKKPKSIEECEEALKDFCKSHSPVLEYNLWRHQKSKDDKILILIILLNLFFSILANYLYEILKLSRLFYIIGSLITFMIIIIIILLAKIWPNKENKGLKKGMKILRNLKTYGESPSLLFEHLDRNKKHL